MISILKLMVMLLFMAGIFTPMVAGGQEAPSPKYVFLFIGDGLSYPQIQLTSNYLGALAQKGKILEGGKHLSFMKFPIVGTVTTFDSTSFCPDSASTATSIASGRKTHSGVVGMDETRRESYLSIAERLKAETNYKIGVVSSVNLNHATPAAFYAHQPSRNNYYEIALELLESDFDYFAGGGILYPKGRSGLRKNIYDLATKFNYKVVTDHDEMETLTSADGKVILIDNKGAMDYEIDRGEGENALADYVERGIELLDNEKGFFMVVEGGKIDWACHANDAGSTIDETLALADAVETAIQFYNKHPEETLILVTGDHETGGLTVGYAGTKYDTFLTNFENQKISYEKFDKDYVEGYIKNKTPFAKVMADVEDLFGLIAPPKITTARNRKLRLTKYEVKRLKEAYDRTLADDVLRTNAKDYLNYGTYNPFSVTVTHILNNKSGINFASYSHTGIPVAMFAQGVGSENFTGFYDNTEIYHKLVDLLQL